MYQRFIAILSLRSCHKGVVQLVVVFCAVFPCIYFFFLFAVLLPNVLILLVGTQQNESKERKIMFERHLGVGFLLCSLQADVNYSQTLDFLEYIHWSLELSSVIPCVPQKPILMFIKEIFTTYAEATDGKVPVSFVGWQGTCVFYKVEQITRIDF